MFTSSLLHSICRSVHKIKWQIICLCLTNHCWIFSNLTPSWRQKLAALVDPLPSTSPLSGFCRVFTSQLELTLSLECKHIVLGHLLGLLFSVDSWFKTLPGTFNLPIKHIFGVERSVSFSSPASRVLPFITSWCVGHWAALLQLLNSQ